MGAAAAAAAAAVAAVAAAVAVARQSEVGGSLATVRRRRPIGDSQLCFLRCDDISDEDSTMCLLDGGDR